MPRIYKISRAGLNLIYKIRHHKGHGIHSPFVFNLINKVIEEKLPYYAFNDIQTFINLKTERKRKISKINRLSFRLINHFNARTILEIGSGKGYNSLFLTAAHSRTICHSIETDIRKRSIASVLYNDWNRHIEIYPNINFNLPQTIDCVYLNLKHYKLREKELILALENHLHSQSFIIVEGIRTNKKNMERWEIIKHLEKRTVVLDLFNIGIAFFDPTLYRWEYKISF